MKMAGGEDQMARHKCGADLTAVCHADRKPYLPMSDKAAVDYWLGA
jgi:hypothetical protein